VADDTKPLQPEPGMPHRLTFGQLPDGRLIPLDGSGYVLSPPTQEHAGPPPTPPSIGCLSGYPTRVVVALRFVDKYLDAAIPTVNESGIVEGSAYEMDNDELATRNAALELLRNYFSGEVNCGDYPTVATPEPEFG